MKRRLFLALIMLFSLTSVQAQNSKNHLLEVAKNLEIFNALYDAELVGPLYGVLS